MTQPFKKKKKFVIHDNTSGPWVYYSKWINQTEREKYIWFYLYVESKKQNKHTNELIYTDKQIGGCQRRWVRLRGRWYWWK